MEHAARMVLLFLHNIARAQDWACGTAFNPYGQGDRVHSQIQQGFDTHPPEGTRAAAMAASTSSSVRAATQSPSTCNTGHYATKQGVRLHRPLLALPKRRISYLVNLGLALTALSVVRICRVAAVHIRPPCRGRRAYVMPWPLHSIQSAAALCSVQLHTHSRHQSRVD